MHYLARLAVTVTLALAAHATMSAEYRDAREQVPPALLGIWKVDMDSSTYSGSKPKVALRSFQYTQDGKVLVTFITLNAAGVYSTGHWAAQLDGTDAIEYHSSAGSIPYNVVRLTKLDERNLQLVVLRHGQVSMNATYQISEDGTTLTYKYGSNVLVYRRWDQMNW